MEGWVSLKDRLQQKRHRESEIEGQTRERKVRGSNWFPGCWCLPSKKLMYQIHKCPTSDWPPLDLQPGSNWRHQLFPLSLSFRCLKQANVLDSSSCLTFLHSETEHRWKLHQSVVVPFLPLTFKPYSRLYWRTSFPFLEPGTASLLALISSSHNPLSSNISLLFTSNISLLFTSLFCYFGHSRFLLLTFDSLCERACLMPVVLYQSSVAPSEKGARKKEERESDFHFLWVPLHFTRQYLDTNINSIQYSHQEERQPYPSLYRS